MPYQSEWLTLAEAVAQLERADEPQPLKDLRRACADLAIRSRGQVEGCNKMLDPEWWHAGAKIDVTAGQVIKGKTSRSVPRRTLTHKHDRLGPDDWQVIRVRGNRAEHVQLKREDIVRVFAANSGRDIADYPSENADKNRLTFHEIAQRLILHQFNLTEERVISVLSAALWRGEFREVFFASRRYLAQRNAVPKREDATTGCEYDEICLEGVQEYERPREGDTVGYRRMVYGLLDTRRRGCWNRKRDRAYGAKSRLTRAWRPGRRNITPLRRGSFWTMSLST